MAAPTGIAVPSRTTAGAAGVAGALLALLAAGAAAPLVAQDPPLPPDSVVAPTPADTVVTPTPPAVAPLPPDTAGAAAARGPLPADTIPADTVEIFYNLPSLDDGRAEGWEAGTWVWDHEQIMASGANTLVELVAEVPGVVPLPAGDYGTPAAFSAFGLGAGGVRVVRDGFEVLPLAGGVVDLQRVGLGGIERVRLRREGGQIVVDLWSFDHEDDRPMSLVEAGTGDLQNNLFRGTFTAPNALGGSVGVALERSDSRGAGRGETGSRTGTWLRYQLHRGDGAGLAVDFRRVGSRSEVEAYASPQTRTDLTFRARVRLFEGAVAEAYTGRSTHEVTDARARYATEGGTTGQHGARLALDAGGAWAHGAFRLFTGDALAENRLDLSAGWRRSGVGGVTGWFTREDWKGWRPRSRGVSAWLGPLAGLSLFGSWDSGRYGARSGAVLDVTPPVPGPDDPPLPDVPPWEAAHGPVLVTSERTTHRAGASVAWGRLFVSGALLGATNDLSLPLGTEPDRGALPAAGAERRGWEVYGRVPSPLPGLDLVGSYQEWDVPGPYLPARIYRGSLDFHRTFMDTGNLELWWSLGVRGHDPMEVFVAPGPDTAGSGLATVPFFQSWYGRIQVRIVTVRIFVAWENLSVRRNLQAYPGRILPALRTSYGIRWNMWN